MNEAQSIMKFELLPNEILMACFQYLDGIDIFYSFDSLNSRFYHLIRNISLHLNIKNIQESILNQFCCKLSSDSQMKKHIISLKISDTHKSNNINILLSFISLDELSELQSLTINDLDNKTALQISSMLLLLTNLRYFCLWRSSIKDDNILSLFPTSTLQILTIPTFHIKLNRIYSFPSLVNLTISYCSVGDLCDLFKYSPNIEYLYIESIIHGSWSTYNQLPFTDNNVIYLKRLTIEKFSCHFNLCEILLKRTPNLQYLMIASDDTTNMIHDHRWKQLITTSIPHLRIFKFKFSFLSYDEESIINRLLQNDFWEQWNVECIYNKNRGLFYTVPYISNEYVITSSTKRYNNKSFDNPNTFINVTDLTLSPHAIIENSQYYFPNVMYLTLGEKYANRSYTYSFLELKQILYIQTMVNLSAVIHLNISFKCEFESSSVMLQLLKETPYLSSLNIKKDMLLSFIDNHELCEYFNKMIKKLDIAGEDADTFLDSKEIIKICQVFSNMEEFRCDVCQPYDLQLTLNQLSKLLNMKIFSYNTLYSITGNRWLEDNASKLDSYSFIIKCETEYYNGDYDNEEDFYYYSTYYGYSSYDTSLDS